MGDSREKLSRFGKGVLSCGCTNDGVMKEYRGTEGWLKVLAFILPGMRFRIDDTLAALEFHHLALKHFTIERERRYEQSNFP